MNRLRIITESPRSSSAAGCGSGSCGCGGAEAAPELELAEVQERLGAGGPRFWRSFEELADTAEFQELVEREFPRHAFDNLPTDGVSRRQFLHLSGASLALAGLTACTRQPVESMVPYVNLPEGVTPGQALYFATAFPLGGYGTGVLAKSHMGRPIKIEGNPDHPSSKGGTDLFAQASVLGMYDPDRSQNVIERGQVLSTWAAFTAAMVPQANAFKAAGGAGLAVLTGTVTSPTVAAQMRSLRAAMPAARWYQYESAGRHNAHRGAVTAFGRPAEAHFDLAKADVIVSLDADFLTQGPGAPRYARDFADRRRIDGHDAPNLSRFYILETTPTSTGTVADHRLALAPSEVARFAAALAGSLGVPGASGAATGEAARWVPAVAADLRAAGARGLVVAGDSQPPAVHVLAHAMNQALGAIGSTVHVTEPVAADPVDHLASIAELARDLESGSIRLLLILGANPAFDAPGDLGFEALLGRVTEARKATLVHLGAYVDETAAFCHWHIPEAHFLETWGDLRGHDGTATIQQPLIDPLFGGKAASEVLALFGDRTDATAYQLVQATWTGQLDANAWAKALNDGVVPGTAAPALAIPAVAGVGQAVAEVGALPASGTEIVFRPDPSIWDGRFANNAWLQECPKPITTLTWDNAVLMSPRMAEALGVEYESSDVDPSRPMMNVTVAGKTVALPAWIVPGHADGAVTVHFGYGRRQAGGVGSGVGVDVSALRTAATAWTAPVTVVLGSGAYPLAVTQHHNSMHGRHLLRIGTVDEYKANHHFVHEMGEHVPDASFYPLHPYPGQAWGMAVDLAACTGCNACVVACQSENNIPTVGKEQVINGREMHWLRIDRYYEGEDALAVGSLHNQPVLCQQCEVAPCEPVCPVAATVHSDEGLNDMVYNRCVGTRYCSNNCPYKVRRFNFLKYTDHKNELLKMVKNPEVTVRMRGVMEKCTYCVQRISAGRIATGVQSARHGGSDRVPDGTIQTACQQACPSGALVFGDINDPASEVAKRKALPLNYQLLEELGTRPRTTYLAKLRNPNPALEAARA
jgi:molybdopterin-containing oxidoreductase family iron-sulfur binding subunit